MADDRVTVCSRADCDDKAKAHGLCKRHYDRERGPRHRHREDRVLVTRARNRAHAELAKRHPDEYAEILEVKLADVRAQDAELRRVAEQIGAEPVRDGRVLRLKSGPPADDEDVTDRIVVVPACPRCDEYHANGHRCLHCGATPSRVIRDRAGAILIPADLSDERLDAAIRAGNRRRQPEQEGETA